MPEPASRLKRAKVAMPAKQPATQHKRLEQMLDELAKGDVYMKMAYHPKRVDK